MKLPLYQLISKEQRYKTGTNHIFVCVNHDHDVKMLPLLEGEVGLAPLLLPPGETGHRVANHCVFIKARVEVESNIPLV